MARFSLVTPLILTCHRAILCIVTVSIISLPARGDSTQDLLTEVSQAVKQQEAALINLKVDSSYAGENWDAEKKKWVFGIEEEVSGWYPGLSGSKARVDFHKSLTRWEDGPAPFAESTFNVAYDGRASRTLYTKLGAPTKTFETLRGEITGDRSRLLIEDGAIATGWRFSLFGWGDKNGTRLSRYLLVKGSPTGPKVIVSAEKIINSEKSKIKISVNIDVQQEIFIFDPAYSYALVEYSFLPAGKCILDHFIVEKIKEVAPGIFYPTQVSRDMNDPISGEPIMRAKFKVANLEANNPQFDDGIFSLKWPAGTAVQDMKSGNVVIVAGDADGHVREVTTKIAEVKKMLATAPAATDNPSTMSTSDLHPLDGLKQEEPSTEIKSKYGSTLLWTAVTGLCVVIILIFVRISKRRSVRIIILVGTSVSFFNSLARGQFSPVDFYELHEQKLVNCGVDTAVITMALFDKPVDARSLEPSLSAGTNWERPITMLDLKRCIEKSGLLVKAYKNTLPEELRDEVRKGYVAIIHLDTGESPVGHYFVIAGVSQYGLMIVNPGGGFAWVTVDDFKARYGSKYDGYAMMVSKHPEGSDTAMPKVLSFDGSIFEVNVGEVMPGPGELVVTVPVNNKHDVSLNILDAKGSCGCFKSATFAGDSPKSIGPLSEGKLLISFSRSILGAGEVERLVMIHMHDVTDHDQLIKIRANVVQNPKEPQLTWFPSQIDMGLIIDARKVQSPQDITVIVPSGIKLGATSTDIKGASIDLIDASTKLESKSGDSTVVRYSIKFAEIGKSGLHGHFLIQTSNFYIPLIDIPVSGEYRNIVTPKDK